MKTKVLAFLLLCSSAMMAQQLRYFLPSTKVVLEVTYEEVVTEQGPFYQYSERYLNTKDVVTASATRYEMKKVEVGTKTIADKAHPFYFTPNQQGMNGFVLSKDGILLGVNIPSEAPAGKQKSASNKDKTSTEVAQVMPLLEEQMMASSTAKMAEGAAKQIYRLRESRQNLLAGDVDKMPADGRSTDLLLKELDKQEKALTALFVGKTTRTIHHSYITLEMDSTCQLAEEVAFRFSTLEGVVEADNLSGEPYYVTVCPTFIPTVPEVKKAPAASPVSYRVPGEVMVTVTDGVKTQALRSLTIAQLGYTAYLPADALKSHPQIRMNKKTGEIQSIE